MAFVNADRVKETSTTTGTGTYNLGGAVTGFRTFVAGIGNANLCNYVAENGTDWEVGIGTVTDAAPDTLARTLILASSNAGVAVNWGAGSKNLFCASLAANRNPKTKKLASDHAISSTTATEVTGLELVNIQSGTYKFEYWLIVQSATATVSPMYGVNFTGTAAVRKMWLRYLGTGVTGITGVADDVGVNTGQIHEGNTVTAFSTTAPNLGHTGGVGTINVDILICIEGIMIVTAAGNLEFWHSSETATSTTIKAGSSVILTRIDD